MAALPPTPLLGQRPNFFPSFVWGPHGGERGHWSPALPSPSCCVGTQRGTGDRGKRRDRERQNLRNGNSLSVHASRSGSRPSPGLSIIPLLHDVIFPAPKMSATPRIQYFKVQSLGAVNHFLVLLQRSPAPQLSVTSWPHGVTDFSQEMPITSWPNDVRGPSPTSSLSLIGRMPSRSSGAPGSCPLPRPMSQRR